MKARTLDLKHICEQFAKGGRYQVLFTKNSDGKKSIQTRPMRRDTSVLRDFRLSKKLQQKLEEKPRKLEV
ncbi:hypothetical protein D6850_14660 [Roseovarius spongiae]|uniref:Uncharacterized protein n=1 Tax=Roseovarius spongiae TaxID=2320272 RepID=A0A3A8B844_9RHOB|nr:hypothetical protein D6850_14660 [Roseovarius spongiae]